MTFKLSARSRDKLSGVDERMAAVVHSSSFQLSLLASMADCSQSISPVACFSLISAFAFWIAVLPSR